MMKKKHLKVIIIVPACLGARAKAYLDAALVAATTIIATKREARVGWKCLYFHATCARRASAIRKNGPRPRRQREASLFGSLL